MINMNNVKYIRSVKCEVVVSDKLESCEWLQCEQRPPQEKARAMLWVGGGW